LHEALADLDRGGACQAISASLARVGAAIRMPLAHCSLGMSSAGVNVRIRELMIYSGWPEGMIAQMLDQKALLMSPIHIRCRLKTEPFVTSHLDDLPWGLHEVKQIARAMTRTLGIASVITAPVRLPRGELATVSWAGPLSHRQARETVEAVKAELIVASHYFIRAFRTACGLIDLKPEARMRLTVREWECLRLLAQGCRENEVAGIVGIAPSTVRYYLDNVVEKLGAANRTNAVALAVQCGILGPIG
jgi:DNA-binding CsgD family transcriptional regulator